MQYRDLRIHICMQSLIQLKSDYLHEFTKFLSLECTRFTKLCGINERAGCSHTYACVLS